MYSKVLETEKTLRMVMDFIGEPWDDRLLQHEKFIGGKVAVVDREWSTDQIKKEINKDGLEHRWIGRIKEYNSRLIAYSPMLIKMGYNLSAGVEFDKIEDFNKHKRLIGRAFGVKELQEKSKSIIRFTNKNSRQPFKFLKND